MKIKWSGLACMLGGLGLLMASAPGCVVRARVRPAVVVVDEAPPAPQYQAQPAPRAGHVWVRGHWQWRNNRWKWKRGYWKASRAQHAWVPGHWERRGNRHHWVAGHWQRGAAPAVRHTPPPRHDPGPAVSGGVWIEVAPPAPKVSSPPAPRAGQVWVAGRWKWDNGRWKWRRGRWEAVRTGHAWVPGHWEHRGNKYRWIKGSWKRGGGRGGVQKRDHRRDKRAEPEEVKSRRGRRR